MSLRIFQRPTTRRRFERKYALPHPTTLFRSDCLQVEFYFSSANLSQDRHMFLEMKGAENRPVPIKHIASFKRMHRFQPYSAIVAALRDSNDLIVIDDGKFSGAGNEGVKRKEPLTVPTRDDDD